MLISELARATNETSRTLRFYEASGLLPEPARTPGNYRDYPPSAVEHIHFVRSLQGAGLALVDIASIAHLHGNPSPLSSTDAAPIARIDTRLDTLRRTRQHLDSLTDQTQTEHPAGGPRCHGRLRALKG